MLAALTVKNFDLTSKCKVKCALSGKNELGNNLTCDSNISFGILHP